MRRIHQLCSLTLLCGLLLFCGTAAVAAPGSQSERVLQAFLGSEQAGEMESLGNCLETYNLEQPQLERLLAAARETTSEERRNLLWQALRQTRSTAAREFLRLHLVEDCDHTTRVRYLRSLTNLAPFDVPLLTSLFEKADQANAEKIDAQKKNPEPRGIVEDDLRDIILQLVARETSGLMGPAPYWPEEFREEKVSPPYMITARRTEQAKQAQAQLLRWLAEHAATEKHRLAAVLPAYKVLDRDVQGEFSRGLLAAAKSPEERTRLYPLVMKSWGMDLVPLLVRDESSETDKLGIIQALHEHGSSYGYSVSSIRHGVPTYEFVSKNDASPKVRAAAEVLLKRLRGDAN
jgi:hypothetical protein